MEFAANLGIQGLRVRLSGDPAGDLAGHRHGASPAAARRAQVRRKTKETEVAVEIDLSREGPSSVATGLGFFDHMLEQIAKHGGFCAAADLRRAICTSTSTTPSRTAPWRSGRRCARRWATKHGIARYGFLLAMDEAEAQVALDISGRPYLRLGRPLRSRARRANCPPNSCRISFDPWRRALGAALHIRVRGENAHHMIESCFKGVGRSLRQAIRRRGGRIAEHQGRAMSGRDIVIVASGGANIASLQFALAAPARAVPKCRRMRRASARQPT